MAKFREHEAPAFELCVGPKCKSKDKAPLREIKLPERKDFNWTTSSHLPKRSAQQKRDHGCLEKNKKFTGDVCLETDDKTGKCLQKAPDSFCKTTTAPCSSERKGCPVQLLYVKGKPNLRFCRKKDEPGYLIPVENPEKAQQLAEEACSNFEWWSSNYFEENAPQIMKKAKKAYPKSAWGLPGMGEMPALFENPLVLVGSFLGGIILSLTLLRKK